MKFVDGLHIATYCRTNQSPLAERLRLFRKVCEALRYAHANAVIHRDLKPSNVVVPDFGIARHLENLNRPADSTRAALRLMTPAYAEPEQILGAPVSLHPCLFARRRPLRIAHRAPSFRPVESHHGRSGTDDRRIGCGETLFHRRCASFALSKGGWADLDVLYLTATHKDPARRYGSVEALIRDVDHYLRHEPPEARPDTVGCRCGKFVRRNRRAIYASLGRLRPHAVHPAVHAQSVRSSAAPWSVRSATATPKHTLYRRISNPHETNQPIGDVAPIRPAQCTGNLRRLEPNVEGGESSKRVDKNCDRSVGCRGK